MRKPKKRKTTIAPGAMPETDATWRLHNVGRLMFDGARRFEERVHETVREAGFAEIRFVHLTLTRNMSAGGTRLTTLAARAGMTKQAMSQLVDECERLGIVERRADPQDRRARLISFTPRGRALLHVVHRGIAAAEADMEAAIGHRLLAATRDALRGYLADEDRERGDEAA